MDLAEEVEFGRQLIVGSKEVISKKLEVKKVNFEISEKIDRKSNKTTGKSKKGGQALDTTSISVVVAIAIASAIATATTTTAYDCRWYWCG